MCVSADKLVSLIEKRNIWSDQPDTKKRKDNGRQNECDGKVG